MLIISPSAIVKGTKHPNAAKLFMEFLMSTEAVGDQRQAFRHPVCGPKGVKAAPGRQADRARSRSSGRPMDEIDKGIPEVIEQWRDTFGN